MMEAVALNGHNKAEFPPAHTAEHLLNQTMQRMFGCERSRNAHIERKKSKISYALPMCPTTEQVEAIVQTMNRLIADDLSVTYEYVTVDELPEEVKSDRLPADHSHLLRLVRIGSYDACLCIGQHVERTSQIGTFILLGTNWDAERRSFRLRFKVGAAASE